MFSKVMREHCSYLKKLVRLEWDNLKTTSDKPSYSQFNPVWIFPPFLNGENAHLQQIPWFFLISFLRCLNISFWKLEKNSPWTYYWLFLQTWNFLTKMTVISSDQRWFRLLWYTENIVAYTLTKFKEFRPNYSLFNHESFFFLIIFFCMSNYNWLF